MVKQTIIGRVSDGMPLAQGPRYVNEERNDSFSSYQQQGEFLLQEISRKSLPLSDMIIRIDDQHCFNYLVEDGVCFMALCDSSYPQKLVRCYLQDLAKEFRKFDRSLAQRTTKPYSFVGFGSVIGNIRRHYVDTRTQANLAKLNAKCQQNEVFMTEEFSQIVKRRKRSEFLEHICEIPERESKVWDSKRLEIIALKWTPITILSVCGTLIVWSSLSLRDDW